MTATTAAPYPTKPPVGDNWMIVDVETAPRDGIEHLLEPPAPDSRIKDPEKIAADIAKRTAERDEKLALDYNLNRIVAISWLTPEMQGEPEVHVGAPDNAVWQHNEIWGLEKLWKARAATSINFKQPTLIGFNIRNFDIPVLIQRTRLLGLPTPLLDYSKYSKEIVDLFEELTFFQGFKSSSAMRRRLKNYCTLFGIPQPDDCDGADVPKLIAEGQTDKVIEHCKADVLRTYEIAKRLGVIKEK